MEKTDFPFIDPDVSFVGISRLREMNASRMRRLENMQVYMDGDQPLAVMLPYKKYLKIQERLQLLKAQESK